MERVGGRRCFCGCARPHPFTVCHEADALRPAR
jgi:hypothetical protein